MTFLFLSVNSMLILFCVFNLSYAYRYVVMKAESTESSNDFCVNSLPKNPLQKQALEAKPLEIISTVDWCANDSKSNASDQILLIPSGNCSLKAQVQNFYGKGGKVILLINNGSVHTEFVGWTGLSVMTISKNAAKVLKEMGEIITIRLFIPPVIPGVDFMLALGIISVFTAAVGSYGSGLTSYAVFSQRVTSMNHSVNEVPEVNRNDSPRQSRLQQFLVRFTRKVDIGAEDSNPVIVLNPCFAVYFIAMLVLFIFIGYLLREHLWERGIIREV